MSDDDVPYFIENGKWYYYDEEEEIYKLTKEAPKEAIESYNEYYKDDDTDIE